MSKKIISNLFNYAAREGARGLVIEGVPDKIALNYHFDDGEERSFGLPKKLEKDLSLTLRQILKLAPDELASKKYCKIDDKNFRLTFYLTILPSQNGEKIIINIIRKNHRLLRLNQLGLQRDNLKTIKKVLKNRSGLILLSSPHGSGKNMTMFSLLQELDTTKRSAYFLGDKLEYKIDGLNNLVSTKNNWTKVLNIDSEIIATEITNNDDLKNVISAASSGRLVLASIMASSVWEVLLAYLRLKLPLKLKVDSLKLITNQQLFPLKKIEAKRPLKTNRQKKIRRQNIGLFEVLELTPQIKKFLIDSGQDETKDKFWEKLGKLAIKEGYAPLSADYQKKVKNGLLER